MDALEPLVTALHNEGRLRVWSLVVTVFGDAVQMRGGRIATLRLQHLLERVGVEAGALRTALSRLTSDGWVLRDRIGRNSFYRLSESGQAEITAASEGVYAPPFTGEVGEWKLVSGVHPPVGGIKVAAHLWLLAADQSVDVSDCLCLTGAIESFPERYANRVVSEEHRLALEALWRDIAALKDANLSALEAMAARMLLIHRWRRIVLRFSEVPPELFPADFAMKNPRQQVAQTYRGLITLSENWMDSTDHGMTPMPASAPEFMHRFRE